MKTEKVKKIVGNLLTKWSVTDEDKIEFLKELESKFAEPGNADEEDLEPKVLPGLFPNLLKPMKLKKKTQTKKWAKKKLKNKK